MVFTRKMGIFRGYVSLQEVTLAIKMMDSNNTWILLPWIVTQKTNTDSQFQWNLQPIKFSSMKTESEVHKSSLQVANVDGKWTSLTHSEYLLFSEGIPLGPRCLGNGWYQTCFWYFSEKPRMRVGYLKNGDTFASQDQSLYWIGIDLDGVYMGVSKNSSTPKWMVYNGKPY